MRTLFWLGTILNGLALLTGLWIGLGRLLTGHSHQGAVLAPLGAGLLFGTVGALGYWLWTAGYAVAACWVSLTLWLTLLVAASLFLLLILGERWN